MRKQRQNTACSAELQARLDAVKRWVEELERSEKDPYVELNKEEATVEAGKHAGLGLTSDGPDPDRYGGRDKRRYLNRMRNSLQRLIFFYSSTGVSDCCADQGP